VVTSAEFEITDDATGRVLPMRAEIPEGEGPFPVVIWSHGGGANPNGHREAQEWGHELAAQGYVVLHVAHLVPNAETGPRICEIASIPEEACVLPEDIEESGIIAIVKTLDVVAILNNLDLISALSEEQGGPALATDRVAVAGWSGGSRAPQMLMGARIHSTESSDTPLSLADPRPAAVVALSPSGPGYAGFFEDGDDHSYSTMRAPVFMATGDNDIKAEKPDLFGSGRRKAFDLQPNDGERWLLYSNLPPGVGGHGTFELQDLESDDERVASFSAALSSSVRAFLDATVLEEDDAMEWLSTDRAQRIAGDADEAEWINR